VAIALLDVNVLVALFRETHVHHEIAHDWFADHGHAGWASCPLTENGMLRILSRPSPVEPFVPLPDLVGLFKRFCENSSHQFWADDIAFSDPRLFQVSSICGHQQLTDVYLLGLAVRHSGKFVTLDAAVPLAAVKGARPENLVVLTSAA
jgi:toxin-antitoxin system PIN domain toxin